MISFAPIWAIVLRHSRVWKRDINLILMTFYWPILDILIWGFLGTWIQNSQTELFHNYEITAVMGILLWSVVGRGANIIGFSLTEELWSNNVVNLFSLPLKITDWIIGILLFTLFIVSMTFLVCTCFIFTLYDVSLWQIIKTFIIFMPPLFFCAIWLGFVCLQIVITVGKRGTELGFVVAWFLAPFSGAYYPIDVLPHWGKLISAGVPMSYIFEGMRGYLMHQQDPTSHLVKGYGLGIFYAIIAILVFVYCFNRAKRNGLARLID